MVTLAHYKKQNLEQLLKQLTAINRSYAENVYGVEKNLLLLIDEAALFFQQIGKNTLESKTITLKSHLSSAMRGLDPKTLERIQSHKRDTVKLSCFYGISQLSGMIEDELTEIDKILEDAESNVSQILITLLNSQVISYQELMALEEMNQIRTFWNELTQQNNQIKMFEIQLKQKILNEDIYLLISNVIDNIKNDTS